MGKFQDEREEEISEWPDDEKLRSIVECPVCFGVPFGELRVCNGGHHVCKYCLERMPGLKVKECPCCKVVISMTGSCRSFLMENIIAGGTFSCPKGCNAVRQGDKMVEHIDNECKHREVVCPFCYSNGDGVTYYGVKVVDFVNHVRSKHNIKVGTEEDGLRHEFEKILHLNVADRGGGVRTFSPNLFKYDGQYFLLRFESIRHGHQIMSIWVQVVGGKEEADVYESRILLDNKHKNSISWKIPVAGIRNNKPVEGGNVATLTLNQLQGFSTYFTIDKDILVSKLSVKVFMSRKEEKQSPGPLNEGRLGTE